MRNKLTKITQSPILFILLIGAIGVQTMVSCTTGDGGGNTLYYCQLSSGGCIQTATVSDCSQAGGSITDVCQDRNSSPYAGEPNSSSSIAEISSSSTGAAASSSSQISNTSSSSKPSSSSASTAYQGRCKDTQDKDYYCEWTSGCYAIDTRYAETPDQSCSALVEECRMYGRLFAGVFEEGTGLRCESSTVEPGTSNSSSKEGYVLKVIMSPYVINSAVTFQAPAASIVKQGTWNTSTGVIENVYSPNTLVILQGYDKRVEITRGWEIEKRDYTFSGFSGDIFMTSSNNQATINMTGNRTVTINFSGGDIAAIALTDSRDYKEYSAVNIGNVIWMTKNLNYDNSNKIGSCYGNEAANCTTYGRLYTWDEAKTACPSGWHLPSNGEWQALIAGAGGEEVAGGLLKNPSGWTSSNGIRNEGLTFAALPGGRWNSESNSFSGKLTDGFWWSSYEDNNRGGVVDLIYAHNRAPLYSAPKTNKFSVRCIKN